MRRNASFYLLLWMIFALAPGLEAFSQDVEGECRNGVASSCYGRGVIESFTGNTLKAMDYFSQACGLGHLGACKKYSELRKRKLMMQGLFSLLGLLSMSVALCGIKKGVVKASSLESPFELYFSKEKNPVNFYLTISLWISVSCLMFFFAVAVDYLDWGF